MTAHRTTELSTKLEACANGLKLTILSIALTVELVVAFTVRMAIVISQLPQGKTEYL